MVMAIGMGWMMKWGEGFVKVSRGRNKKYSNKIGHRSADHVSSPPLIQYAALLLTALALASVHLGPDQSETRHVKSEVHCDCDIYHVRAPHNIFYSPYPHSVFASPKGAPLHALQALDLAIFAISAPRNVLTSCTLAHKGTNISLSFTYTIFDLPT
jgi:hypothetical protein